MDIRFNTNPGMRAAYLANQIAAGKTKKTAAKSGLSRSQDTVVFSEEARAAYANEQAKKTAAPQTVPEAKSKISMNNSGTTFFWWGEGATKLEEDLRAQGKTTRDMSSYVEHEIAIQQTIRKQISESVQDLLKKNGITIPEGQSFTMDVSSYDFYIHVKGLEDPELTEAVEKAINVGENGYRLQCHISDCRRLTRMCGLTVPSAADSLSEAKESLYHMVQDLTGYDIRELPREDGKIYTPDGQDLWDVLREKASHYKTPDGGIVSIDISKYLAIYQRIAQLGWDSVADPVYQLLYQDGGLYDVGTDYGFGPGQTGWHGWAHEHAEEVWDKITAGVDQPSANHASRTYAAPRTSHDSSVETKGVK